MGTVEDFVSGISAGSWPDWLAAGGTSLALVIAALSYRRSVQIRHEAQARLVYSYVTDHLEAQPGDRVPMKSGAISEGVGVILPAGPTGDAFLQAQVPLLVQTVVVHNGSQELIGPVKVQLTDIGRGVVFEDCAYIVDSVKPNTEARWTFYLQNQSHPGSPSTGSTIVFRDASGSWWRRNRSEPVHHVHEDPENVRWPKAMREVWDRNAISMGLTPSPEPKVPLRVRVNRLRRRLQGKHPIP